MKNFIFRNSTIERFFGNEYKYSGYENLAFDEGVDVFIWFYIVPFKSEAKNLGEEISSYYDNLSFVLDRIPSGKEIIIFTLHNYLNTHLATGEFYLDKAIYDFNQKIIRLSEINNNIKIINFSDFCTKYSNEELIDWKFYYISQTLLNPRLARDFKIWFQKQREAILFKRKKCIVVDLDNTLWGGVLGEDGLEGIKIGGDYPGNAFLDFQKKLLQLVKSGVILSICSKNNETDVKEVWKKNPNNLIKNEHISSYRINWKNKAENIQEIVNDLNIGFDSVVFIDDNPAERELVKKFHPLIETPDFPKQPYMLADFSKKLFDKYFKIYRPTNEDKGKTEHYKTNAKRSEYKRGFSDFSEYLTNLNIEIQIQEANAYTIPRIAQMTQKTNQFNLTTKRYSETDIKNFMENGHKVYCINVSDKFGDNGITGLIIILLNNEEMIASIDSFLLSCRILGKGIEEAFFLSILKRLKQQGFKKINASYIQTQKNSQVNNFYDKLKFAFIEKKDVNEKEKYYSINLLKNDFKIQPYYKLNFTE